MIRLTPPPPPAPGRAGAPARSGVVQGCFPAGRPTLGAAVQRKSIGPAGGNAFQLPPALAIPNHGGAMLPPALRGRMEGLLKADLSDVRIHVGPAAPALGALAFATGSHVHFAPGQFQPQTARGLQLLGRQLAHVVQQRQGRVRNPFGGALAIVQDPALEREAERIGLAFATAPPAPPRPGPPVRAAVQMMERETKQVGHKLRTKVTPSQRHREFYESERPSTSGTSSRGRKIKQTAEVKDYLGKRSSRILGESDEEQAPEVAKPKSPPPGWFLSYGLRKEVPWAAHPKTGGQVADKWLYAHPHDPGDVDATGIRPLYKCFKCGGFFPRKDDLLGTETVFITVDHVPSYSMRLNSGRYRAEICDGAWVWEGQLADVAKQDYNDPDQLRYMCSSHNSSRGGLKGYEKLKPNCLGTHDEYCNHDPHTDVKLIGT